MDGFSYDTTSWVSDQQSDSLIFNIVACGLLYMVLCTKLAYPDIIEEHDSSFIAVYAATATHPAKNVVPISCVYIIIRLDPHDSVESL